MTKLYKTNKRFEPKKNQITTNFINEALTMYKIQAKKLSRQKQSRNKRPKSEFDQKNCNIKRTKTTAKKGTVTSTR